MHPRLEHLVAALPGRLGRVHGHVGVSQQLVGRLAVERRERDPDAHVREHLLAADEEGRTQDGEGPLGDLDRHLGVRAFVEQDGELVATQAGHRVARPHTRAQPLADLPEKAVTGAVAEAVVDRLEPVHVQE